MLKGAAEAGARTAECAGGGHRLGHGLCQETKVGLRESPEGLGEV